MSVRTVVKWAATSLARTWEEGKPTLQQVTYLGKTSKVVTWTPYGFDSSPPKGKLALLFSLLLSADDQVALVGSPGEGPELAEGEVAVYHPATGNRVHFLDDGRIEIIGTDDILIRPGSEKKVEIDGNLEVTGDATVAGAAVAQTTLDVQGAATFTNSVTSGGKDVGGEHTHSPGSYESSQPVTGSSGVPE